MLTFLRIRIRILSKALALGLIGGLTLTLSACGPFPERVAYEECTERARLAAGPRGEVGIGFGSDGPVSNLSLEISSDFIAGRDPYLVYENCFRNLTGSGPTRPLIL